MRQTIIICLIITVLQIVDVSIATVTIKGTRTKLSANEEPASANSGKYATTKTLQTKKRSPRAAAVVDRDEDGDVTDGGPEPAEPFAAGGRLLKTAADEAGKQVFGAADEAADLLKVSGGTLGRLLGDFVRNQLMKHAAFAAEFKAGLLSGLGDCLAGGFFHAMRSALDLGGEGARMMCGAVRDATDVGKMAAQAGGAALTAPLKMTSQVLNKAKRGAAAPFNLLKSFSNAALGDNNDETDAGDRRPDDEEEDDKGYVSPPPALKTKRVASKRINN